MIPTPVHHNSGDGGTEIPTSYLVAYLVAALVVWLVAALYIARTLAHNEHRHPFAPAPGDDQAPPPPTNEQIGEAIIAGGMIAAVWPLSALAAGLWLTIRHLTGRAV